MSLVYVIACEDLGGMEPAVSLSPHPDLSIIDTGRFGIDDARTLSASAYGRPMVRDVRTCVVYAREYTREAQNALLKLLEEPPLTTDIYLGIPRVQGLIPTVLSRVQVHEQVSVDSTSVSFDVFLAAPYRERIVLIQEKLESKDMAWCTAIYKGVLNYIHTHFDTVKPSQNALVQLLSYAGAPGTSHKMLLEYCAIVLP